jgi:Animal haem peroxidase
MDRNTAGANGVCPFSGAGAPEPRQGGRFSRRSMLAGLTSLAAAPLLGRGVAQAAPGRTPTAPAKPTKPARPRATRGSHAVGNPRGSDIAVRSGRDKEARFGVMFKSLKAFSPPDAMLIALATAMNDGKAPLHDVRDSDVAFDMPAVPAGFVYFGQFVDHDMTLDKTPLTQQQQDPNGMTNYDSPRFDLGSVYGKGPTGSPELYEKDRPGYLLVNDHNGLHDLPRDDLGAAYLGDPRNDENLIVAQLHAVFLRKHNQLMDAKLTFAQAQQQLRWHFQWLIVHDYLPRIAGADVVAGLLRTGKTGKIECPAKYYTPRNRAKPYMPVEYSGAAYRFGHSMIRAEYEVQDGHTVPIFGPDDHEDLRGNRPIPESLWMDWNYFFDIPGMDSPDDRNMARRIDTQLSLPLYSLPPTVVARTTGAIIALAERNLLRGKQLGLPAGQDVAKAMKVIPLTNEELGLTDPGWKGKAPLWFYVLKEAELRQQGLKLGPVGSRIVAEVILGILACDPGSYFNANPAFDPGADYRMGDFLLAADAIDPRARALKPPEVVPTEGAAPLSPGEVINPAATIPVDSTALIA